MVVAKLHAILRPFLLRRMKSDVELMLPRKKEIIIYANMTEYQKNFQEHLINKTLENHLSDKGSGYSPVEQIVEQCGKFCLLDRLLTRLFAPKHKVLIFSQWTKILDLMEYYFSEKGFEVCRINGGVKLDERKRQIQEFNDGSSKYRIFILSTQAGGLGINLTAADTCILYDSDWGRILKRAFSKLKLEHVVIEKGQFHHERTKSDSGAAVEEADLLALLREEDSAEDKIDTDRQK